jgi:hypothetical protein
LTRVPFIDPPGAEHEFKVGDMVEVFCDHEEGSDRVRGWFKGVVVQVNTSMIAVQFQGKVYLTDGWMVPDHVLWCPRHATTLRHYKPGSRRRETVRHP